MLNKINNYNPTFGATLKLNNSLKNMPESMIDSWRKKAASIGTPSDEIVLNLKEKNFETYNSCNQYCIARTCINKVGDFFAQNIYGYDSPKEIDSAFNELFNRISRIYGKTTM